MLARFPSYMNAMEIFRQTSPSVDRAERALRLSAVLRAFAVLRGHEDLADGWAAAGLLYRADIPKPVLIDAGANAGFLHLLTLTDVPPMADPPTASQELGCLLAAIAPLTAIILEMMRTKKRDLRTVKVSAVQKHFASQSFLPGVSRRPIIDGTHALHWEIGDFTSKVLTAIRESDSDVKAALYEHAQRTPAGTHTH